MTFALFGPLARFGAFAAEHASTSTRDKGTSSSSP